MAKKETVVLEANLKQVSVEEVMGDRFGRYSKYIIQDRALPDVRDGLKPVQRRILYAMFHEGNHFDKPYRKSAKTVGLVIGNYHPHGDSSVYEAMVRLSQSWKVNYPLVDMQGNNGSIDDDPAAAMRYTEARLAKLAHALLTDIDEDVVPFVLNFDDTESEPVVLPAAFCNLLVNGATGIAAGYATNIPPFNFDEVMQACIYRLNFPKSSMEDIMTIIQGPDFPTGGIIQGAGGIRDILEKGRGKVVVRSKVEVNVTKTVQQIIVRELPYEVIKSNLVKRIDDYRLNNNLDAILDVRDESDRSGLKIVIDVKMNADVQTILNLLYKNTELQVYYNANMVAIIDKRPVLCSVLTIIDGFLDHRKQVVTRRCQFRIAKMAKRTHILQGLIKAVSILDEIIALIRQSKNKSDAKEQMISTYAFTPKQAEAILTMQLYRLSSTDIVEMRDEFATLVNEIEYLNQVLENENLLKSMIIQEFKDIQAKFSYPRRTAIEAEVSQIEVDKKSLITNERVMVSLSRDGYIKRVSLRSYNSSDVHEVTLKEGDQLRVLSEVNMLDNLLIVNQSGSYIILPVYEINEAKWKEVGSHLSTYAKVDGGDHVVSAFIVNDFKTYQFLTIVSAKGMIKRTPIDTLEVQRLNRSYTLMNLKKNDRLVGVHLSSEGEDSVLVSLGGYGVRLSSEQISIQAPKAQGVKGMNLREKDEVADACGIRAQQNNLCIFTRKGSNKRIRTEDISYKSRPVNGELIAKRVASNPNQVQSILASDLQTLVRINDESLETIFAKDIALMSVDQTYSNSLALHEGFSVVQAFNIVPSVDYPAAHESQHVEPLQLDIE